MLRYIDDQVLEYPRGSYALVLFYNFFSWLYYVFFVTPSSKKSTINSDGSNLNNHTEIKMDQISKVTLELDRFVRLPLYKRTHRG